MKQSTRNVLIVVGVVVLLAFGVWWSESRKAPPEGHLMVAGDVRPDTYSVTAPAITYPVPDYTVGIPKPAGSTGAMSSQKRIGAAPAPRPTGPVVAGMLQRVYVTQGDQVKAGQIVAQFDTTMLDLGVEQAKTAQRKARAEVLVLAGNVDKLDTASSKLTSARAKISTAKSGLLKARRALRTARTDLLAKRKQLTALKAQRPQLEALLAQLKAQASQFPPGQVPPPLQKQISQLTGALASIEPGLKGIAAGLATIDTNLAKVAKGLAALPKASAQISSAASKLAEAKTQLKNAKDVLSIVADSQSIGVRIAEVRRAQATVRAPIDGTVTFARHGGTVAMVGAPLVRIHDSGPQRVDTFLTAEQLATVGIGSEAEISYDSAPGKVLRGRVTEIGSGYVFPPTSFPTQVVHMMRAVRATITLNEGQTAPPGTPVDVSIHTK